MTTIKPEEILCILFGISIYEDEGLPRLPAANTNVLELEGILRKEIGVPDANILSYYNKAATEPGEVYVDMEKELLKKRIDPDDSKIKYIFFYFSGHGVRGDYGEGYYLCLSSTKLSRRKNTALDVKDVCEILSKYNKKMFVVIDACFSQNITVELAAGKGDYYAMSSSSFDELTDYPPEKYHSAFTENFLQVAQKGIPNVKMPWIPFTDIYNGVYTGLVRNKFPEPRAHGNPLLGDYALFPNKAYGQEEVFSISRSIFENELAKYDKTIKDEVEPGILERYPLFISNFLKDILQKDSLKTGQRDFFLTIYNRIVRFLSFIVIKSLPGADQQTPEHREIFNKWKTFPKHKDYYDILMTGCKYYPNQVVSELTQGAPFLDTIEKIEISQSAETPADLSGLRQAVINLIKQMAFLCQYNLLAVRFIMVKKGYFLPIVYQHETSDLFGFNYKQYMYRKFPIYIHNGAVILYRRSGENIPEENKYVNLWPLVIDANGVDKDSDKPNIQFYSGTEANCRFYYEDSLAKKKDMQNETHEYEDLLSFPSHDEWEEYFKKF